MAKGGKRKGAGRPLGSGKYKQPTKAIRVPISEVENILNLLSHKGDEGVSYHLPLYQNTVSAGFPSPADDHIETKLNLNELLIKHPSATFFLKVSGNSMIKAAIHDGDILVVDRSLEPSHGKIVIASVNGELTVKRLSYKGKKAQLIAENKAYAPIDITEEMDVQLWGVVTTVIHPV